MCGLSVESAISVIVLEYEYTNTQLGFKFTALGLQCEYFPSSVTEETSRRDLAELPQSTLKC